jgi:hypothetical protein
MTRVSWSSILDIWNINTSEATELELYPDNMNRESWKLLIKILKE